MIQFENVHEESKQRIRQAFSEFLKEHPGEAWELRIFRAAEEDKFRVHITDPDGIRIPMIEVDVRLDSDKEIVGALERVRDEWEEKTTPPN